MLFACLCALLTLLSSEASASEQFVYYYVNEEQMPLVISPADADATLASFEKWATAHQRDLKKLIESSDGAILLRGFPVDRPEDFASVVRSVIGRELLSYRTGAGARTEIVKGVYTSTEAPPKYHIPLHNELSYTHNAPAYICFYCDVEPAAGTGQTLIGSTERVTHAMLARPDVWELFEGRTLNYINRHPPAGSFFNRINPSQKTWPHCFETEDRDEVARLCKERGLELRWNGDWAEVIVPNVPAIKDGDAHFNHPYWFNQAHLHHFNRRMHGGWINTILAHIVYCMPSTRQGDVVFSDDGSQIPTDIIYQIYDVLDAETVKFDWKKGDVMILDNFRALHGRAPTAGPRRILVCMVEER